MRSDHRTESLKQRHCRRLFGLDAIQFLREFAQTRKAECFGHISLVGEVVGRACEGVDQLHRCAKPGG
jgi:hypothetical protein